MRRLSAAIVGVALAVYGCSGSDDSGNTKPTETPNPGPDTSITSQIPPPEESTLRKVQTCDDLSGAIKNDALKKMNDAIDAQVDSIKLWFDGQFGGVATGDFGSSGGAADRGEANSGAGASSSSSGGAAPPPSAPSAPATDYSQTNTQVKGVDEADIVKNDGKYLYILHGNTFQIVTAFPAAELAASNKVDIEGQPTEMFVANNKAVIFSTVAGTQIYQSAGVTPRSKYTDPYGKYYPPCGGGYCGTQNPLTKITVLGVNNTSAGVERELYFEGNYTSSRRVDANVRVILEGASYGPQVVTYPQFQNRQPGAGPITREEYLTAYEDLRQKNIAAINATTLRDWLPYTFIKNGSGGFTADTVACDKFFVPTASTTQHGITQIASFNLNDPNVNNAVAIVGAVDTVYSNADTMVLAAHAWINPKTSTQRPQGRKAPFVDFMPSTATYLHRFDLKSDPSSPKYAGSGWVRGTVLNQFSIDERDGAIRVATTEQRSVRTWISDDEKVRPFINSFSVNHVYAVKPKGEALKVVGDVGDLAPGERIFSTRFVGTKGYVVTFRQIDPLFVVDLANPEQPKVLGQLKIPGFSEYMHPLDEGHLLTIGRDTEGNVRQGIAIQIFDVTDPVKPALMHKHVFDSQTYGYSEAEQNHKAFTYYEQKKLLSFPFYGYQANTGSYSFRSSAELFSIDLAAGITKIGSVDHTSLFGTNYRGYCNGYYSPHVRRSVFMDDVLYSISYGGVIASDTKNLGAAPLKSLNLAAPLAPPGSPYTCQ